MALSTYDDLRFAVAAWLNRDDLEPTIPDLITMAEARFARDLRTHQMQTVATLDCVAGEDTVDLPTDWLETKSLRLVSPNTSLEYLAPEDMAAVYPAADSGAPQHFNVLGSTIKLAPVPDDAYEIEIRYFAKVPALSDTAQTNWLLSAHPSLYLFATMAEACTFIVDDERAPLWESKYSAELASLRRADAVASMSGSTLRMRSR